MDTLSLLKEVTVRVEKAKHAVRVILGEEQPLTTQEAAITPAPEKTKMLPTIFISYSHKDEKEKEKLLSHLGVLRGAGLIDLWNDDQIVGGSDWESEIHTAIGNASVAILLVTANFLNSDFILGNEVPALLQRRRSEGLVIFPVIAKACAWRHVSWLAKMNVRPKNGRPVWSDIGSHVDEDLAMVAEEVAVIIKRF